MTHSLAEGPWLLGLLAGGTIVLGLPIARLRHVTTRARAFLNAVSTGVLIFLLVEMSGHLLEGIEELVEEAIARGSPLTAALRDGGLFVLGFSLGLLGMVYFERRFLGAAKNGLAPRARAKQIAFMIAVGLGLHNFSEGLAIGQGYAAGAMRLAWLLAIGFALHNATEGFGIAAPLSGHQVRWRFLLGAGVIAGGPTFLGAIVGGWWANKPAETFCLALASGTILYIVGELLHLGRQLKEESVVGLGLLTGFFVAVLTDFLLIGAMAHGSGAADAHETHESRYDLTEVGEHAPRHGGFFGDADDLYHYELVLDAPNQLRLYVNDERNRPLNVRLLQGRWTLDPDESAPRTGAFSPAIDGGYFMATLPLPLKSPVHVEVAVQKGSVWAPMEFFLPAPSILPDAQATGSQ
ncbi:MAG: ZIP family metal transporter [Candidatus Omnitrophica bacterium]|nr:ZIP family metal transporter [Candidatus Omnitrophota bacterium]